MELIRLLKEAGMVPGTSDADALRDLFQKLKILVGEVTQSLDPLPLTTTDVVDNFTVSSHYASAVEDGSDTSSEPPQRMPLGRSGASMLEARSKTRRPSPARSSRRDNGSAPTYQATTTESSDRSVGTFQKFFNAAMDRYLAEERETNQDPATTRPQHQGSQDVEMEFIRSSDHGSRWEYDPDGVDIPTSAQAIVATAAAGSTGSTMIQRARISAISDLKDLTRKMKIERERGSAKSSLRLWEIKHQMTKTSQYYLTRRRSDESPLDYLYWLNVAGLRARPKIKDGSAKERCKYVDHYIETLEDLDLAERLTLLRLTDADHLDEIQANDCGSDSKLDESGRSYSDVDCHRRIFVAANEAVTPKVEIESTNLDPRLRDGDPGHQDHNPKTHGNGFNRDRCSHCGSRKHSDLGCWKRVICTKCGKREHPSDHCLFVCRACGKLHDMGKCPIEEFYNQIRQWFNPTKHMGMLPEAAEKMYCIYAFVNKKPVDQVSERPDLHGNTCDLHGKHTFAISSLRQVDEYASAEVIMSVDLQPGESRGYCRQQEPDLWLKPTDHEVTPEIQRPSKISEYRRSCIYYRESLVVT
ncbi:hypothetical protein PHMEG_00031984, partial [Phytophthora megakarya]